jgi:hypothetical protein
VLTYEIPLLLSVDPCQVYCTLALDVSDFTTDNGAEVMSRTNAFRGEKATNWEDGYRVPMVIRWPG